MNLLHAKYLWAVALLWCVACGDDGSPPAGTDSGDVPMTDSGDVPMTDAGDVPMTDAGDGGDINDVDGDVPMIDAGDVPVMDAGPPMMDAGPRDSITVRGGDVMGDWCGDIAVQAAITIPSGERLRICAGSIVTLARDSTVTVRGTLEVDGTRAAHVRFDSARESNRLQVRGGTIEADYLDITDARLTMSSGRIRMTDSTLDLGHPRRSPDCTNISGGTLELDHCRFDGCHCPLHLSGANDVRVTNSLFDEGAYGMMIGAVPMGRFDGNHMIGSIDDIQDIGGRPTADISGNYWGGGGPELDISAGAMLTGGSTFSDTPIPGVGPR